MLQKDLRAESRPPARPEPGGDYRQYLPYFSKGSDISFPSRARGSCHALWLLGVCNDVISEKDWLQFGGGLSCFGVF